jgi:4-hydroxy-tetrahydrodipicolinate reductase
MKIALLGKGKTGSKVLEIVSNQDVTVFDRQNIPSLDKLKGHDVIISFLPGQPFLELIPLLIETGLPVVTGSTGFDWPKELDQLLRDKKATWIWGHNFSLGINLVKGCLEVLGKGKTIFPEATYEVHETHHTKKLDAPSGTALSFQTWLKQDCQITSDRIGDVIGHHELTLRTEFETIKISHEALDRKIFANGAIYAANSLVNDKTNKISPGLLNFSVFMEQVINL